MLEQECDVFLKRLSEIVDTDWNLIITGVSNHNILVDIELNKIEDFNKKSGKIISILSSDEYIRGIQVEEKYHWQITKKGQAAVALQDTYVKRKIKEDLDFKLKEAQYKNRKLPIRISIAALVISFITIAINLCIMLSKKPITQVTIQQQINKTQILPQSSEPAHKKAPDTLSPKRKNVPLVK